MSGSCSNSQAALILIVNMISKRMNEVLLHSAILADQDWPEYAAYCRARESGRRRLAFRHLSAFIASIGVAGDGRRRKFAHWVCERLTENEPDSGALLPEPLLTEIVIPALGQWRADEPWNSIPLRWLGVLLTSPGHLAVRSGLRPPDEQGESLLRKAINLDPPDQVARVRLIECRIGTLDFNAHHLPEAYLGEPETDLKRVARPSR